MGIKFKPGLSSIVVVSLLGVVLSAAAFLEIQNGARSHFSAVFQKLAHDRTMAVSEELEYHLLEMEGLRRFYEQSVEVTGREFELYTESILMNPGVQAVEWIPRVRQDGRAAFEARTGTRIREQDAGGQLVSAQERSEYFPIELAEPFKLNEPALGFDLGSNPERLAALKAARDQGKPIAMELVHLVENPTNPPVFMLVAPVYRQSSKTLEDRRRNLDGFVLGMYRIDRLVMHAMERVSTHGLAFMLEDLDSASANRLLYRHDPRVGTFDWNRAPDASWKYEELLHGAGRIWRITVFPNDIFIQTYLSRAYRWILPGGLLTTLFVVILLRMQLLGRQRAERLVQKRTTALRASEKEFREMADNAPSLIFRMSLPGGNYEYVSPASTGILGYPPEKLLNTPLLIQEMIHPDSKAYFEEQWSMLLAGEIPPFYEYSIIHGGSGEARWLHQRNTLIRDDTGRPVAIEGIVTDVTERKQAEEALRESEEKFRALYENAPLSYQSLDEQGCFLDVNPAWLKILGYERAEVIGKCFSDFLHPDWKPHFEKNFPAFKKRGYVRDVEFKIRHKDGHCLDISFEGCIGYLPDGSFRQTYCVFQDITERKQTEEALQKSSSLLAAVIDSPDNIIIFALDRKFNYLGFNQAHVKEMKRVYGADIKIGQHILEYISREDDRITALDNYNRVIRGERFIRVEESGESNHRTWYELIFNPIYDDSKYITGLTVFVTDITKRKQTEKDLRESQYRLLESQSVAQIGSYVLDITTGTWESSPVLDGILGIGKDYERSVEGWRNLIHPDDRQSMTDYLLHDVIDKRLPFDREYRILCHDDQKERWVLGLGSLKFDDQGRPTSLIGTIQNITERKLAEQALRGSEERFRTFFENSSDAMLIIENEKFSSSNMAAAAMLGYDNTVDILHRPEALSPEFQPDGRSSVEKAEEMMALAVAHGSHRFEWEHLRKDGTGCLVEIVLTAIVEETGTKLHVVWRDLKDRMAAEEALRASEQKYRLLATNTLDVIWTTDIGFKVTFVNNAIYQLLGYTPEEFIGMHPSEFTTAETLKLVQYGAEQLIASYKDGEILQRKLEVQQIRKDGSLQDIELRTNLLLDSEGQIIGFQGRSVDITDRKEATQEKERLLTAIDQVEETIVITDTEGLIQYVNPAFERITGYTREEAIGQNPRILKSDEQDAAFYKAMWETLSKGEVWAGRFSNRKKDGTIYIEEATISPVKDSEGKTINYVAIKSDITTELAREEQYRQIQKMESVGRLAGGVAHDFNNILQTITGFCGLILAEMDPQSVQREDVLEIQKAALLAGELTQQLLAFSREQPTDCKALDLNTVLSDARKMLRQTLDDSFYLKFKPGPKLRPVNADASQILQIAMNLTVNARDAMPDGGTITLCTQNVEITQKDLSDWPDSKVGKWACFSLSDTGCGMNEKQLAHLFEPFYTTKQLGKGTGLGLSVVYGIVEDHGGWISVSSEPDKGTTFRICLPVYDAAKSGGENGSTDHDAFLGKRILLVEDDPVVRELTAEILQDVGYAVSVATDASEAEQVFSGKDGEFDLLFFDIILPDRNGIELADFFLKQNPELPVLLSSGHSDEHINMSLIKEKGFGFLRKPFSLKRLLDTVDRTITGQAKL